jgi:hypothetical protein
VKHRFALLLPTLLGTASLQAAQIAPTSKYEGMDYGPFLSSTIHNTEDKSTLQGKGCATDKGIAIRLSNGATMVFDTDLLRMSGGWSGGFLTLKGVVFDGKHGPNPTPAKDAKIYFQTNPTPGWSSDSSFKDERPLPTGQGAASRPFGPLPKSQAKYRGLYLKDQSVTLSYTVGSSAVLELPDAEKIGDDVLLTRSFQVTSPGSIPFHLLAAEAPEGSSVELLPGNAGIALPSDPKNPEARLFVGVVGAPAGAQWKAADGRASLQLPKFAGNESFKLVYWVGSNADPNRFTELTKKTVPSSDLTALTKGGGTRWKEVVKTQGEPGTADENFPYAVDSITPPLTNPYNSWIRFGGFDFFPDGRAALCTWSGDVWIASGLDSELKEITWKRYASGLFQALGLKVVDGQVYVLGRDQITRLKDVNNDGEADFYENFNNDVQVTPGFHEFALDLHTDPQGNFYFAKGGPVNPGGRGWGPLSEHNGCVFKVSKDGEKLEVFATGVRAPNGIGVSPEGVVSCGDNQGTWVPACYVHLVQPGDFVGVTDLAHRPEKPTTHGTHVCYLPMDVDNSGGAQTWVTGNKWGPLENRMLHLSYGQASVNLVLSERVDGKIQGGVVRLPLKFDTGIMRARFNPADGQLYVAGLRGWQTKGSKDGGFFRVRYTGTPLTMQNSLRVTDKGLHIGFTNPVDAKSAGDAENYSIEQYNYRWTEAYGSPDFKVSDPEQKGRDPVEIKSVKVAADNRSVFLEIPGLRPVDQMRIKMNLKSADGKDLPGELVHTINAIGKE